jgi:hypothetical protein
VTGLAPATTLFVLLLTSLGRYAPASPPNGRSLGSSMMRERRDDQPETPPGSPSRHRRPAVHWLAQREWYGQALAAGPSLARTEHGRRADRGSSSKIRSMSVGGQASASTSSASVCSMICRRPAAGGSRAEVAVSGLSVGGLGAVAVAKLSRGARTDGGQRRRAWRRAFSACDAGR